MYKMYKFHLLTGSYTVTIVTRFLKTYKLYMYLFYYKVRYQRGNCLIVRNCSEFRNQ